MKSQKEAILLALITVLLWATVATAFKFSLGGLTPLQLILVATGVSLFVFILILILQGRFFCLQTFTAKELKRSALLGFLNPFGYYLILFQAYALLPAQVAQSLNMVWPITLALLSAPLLGQHISPKNIWAIVISFFGVVLIASQGSLDSFAQTSIVGVLLALGSSLVWALYWILGVKQEQEKLLSLTWNFIFGFVYLLLFSLIQFHKTYPIPFDRFLGGAVYVGIFELGITYIVWMKALQKSENNAVTGNFIFLTPFLSLIFIHFVLKEEIYITTFGGLCLILGGILLQQVRKKRKTNQYK